MSFASFDYLALLLVVLVATALLRWRARLLVLLAASYVFYCHEQPQYGLIIAFSTLVDYLAALGIDGSRDQRRRRMWLAAGIGANLGLLGYFKYTHFALEVFRPVLDLAGIDLRPFRLALPAGISFYTFQSMSYILDVYRGVSRPTRDGTLLATYVAFFPQLIAGPIERARSLLPQLARRPRVSFDMLWDGACLVLAGLAKKLVLADRLAVLTYAAYQDPATHDGWELLLALVAMPVSLYLDFSAYTDIARGSGRMLGIELSRNFDFPFAATSPADYWSRWHMTLTRWVRDYVFQPLGGWRRRRLLRSVLNVVLAMGLVGLWHGASWSFIAWGLANGVILAGQWMLRVRFGRSTRSRLRSLLGWLATCGLLLPTAPLFFCPTLRLAAGFWRGLVLHPWTSFGEPSLSVLALFLIVFFGLQAAGRGFKGGSLWQRTPAPLKGALVAGLLYLVLFGSVPTVQRFVYYGF